MQLKEKFQKEVDKRSAQWVARQPARLGNLMEVVETGTPGIYYARLLNGDVIRVYNTLNLPPRFDLHIEVGASKTSPDVWRTLKVFEDYPAVSASAGEITYHAHQHKLGHGDQAEINRQQIIQMSMLVSDAENFLVNIFGDVLPVPGGVVEVQSVEGYDLSGEIVTAGARFTSIEVDNTGALSLHRGETFGAPSLATASDIPVPDPGKFMFGYVLFFESQALLLDAHIRVPMPISYIPLNSGIEISTASEDTPVDADKFGFWQVASNALKSITYENFIALLADIFAPLIHSHVIFDDTAGDPADVTTGSAEDGTSDFAARADHVHHTDASPQAHLVMETGVTHPPVPLENAEGDDWIYETV